MTKTHMPKSVSGYKRQNLLLVLFGATIIFVGFPRFLLIFPNYSESYIGISWVLGVVGFIAIVARNYSSNMRILEIIYIDLITLFMLIAIRSYSYIFPSGSILWSIIIIGSCVISYLIPIFNSSITSFLRRELVAPKTALGKVIAIGALLILPLGGAIGALIGMNSAGQQDKLALAILIGNILWAIALLLPFGTLHPVSSFEKK